MKSSIFGVFTCLFLLCLFAIPGLTQVEEIAIGNTFGVGARTMGMGGASLGVSDDFTALYWNPAGMAQIQKFEFFTSFSHNTANTDSFFTDDQVTGTSRSRLRPNSIGFVYPLYTQQGGLAIAFGYNRPQNFDFQTAIQGVDPSSGNIYSGFLVNETNMTSGGIGIWSFGASAYVTENFLIGGSIDFWSGDSIHQLDVTATNALNVDDNLASFRYDDEVDREYSGIGGRVGILANFTDMVSLGMTLVAPTELTVDEFWREYAEEFYDDNSEIVDPADGKQGFDIERPFEVGAGVAIKLLEKRVILAGDIQLTDWRQTRYDPPPADDISDNHFEEFYSTTFQARLGAEFRIPIIDTHLRVGYFRDAIPFTGTEVENDRDFLTFGVGKIFEDALKFDLAYMWGNWEQYSKGLTIERHTHRVFASGAYRF